MESTPSKSRYALWLKTALIVATTLWVYSPAFHGQWLMDDQLYLPDNPLLHDPARLWKIWFAPGSFIEYYPVEESVQWVQWQLWGTDTFGYHLTNVVLQIINALLVWRLLTKFNLSLAWLGGLIFAIHPVQVESVTWIAELKNTLSLTPFLLAMLAWIDYEERGRASDYAWALGLFLTAMLCKISVSPFPALILLYAWWKRGRVSQNDLKAAVPFLVISLTLIVMTVLTGAWFRELHHTTPEPIPLGGLFQRLAYSGAALVFYFFQFFWPVHLLPFYPQWTFSSFALRQFFPWLAVLAGALWFWRERRSWGRHALLGFGFFFLFIAPFLGFIGISYMTFTRVMDHFLYLPIIGLIGLTVAVLGQIGERLTPKFRPIGAGLLAVVMGAMILKSHAYAGAFVSREATNLYVLARDPAVWVAHNNIGVIYLDSGRMKDAAAEFAQAVALNPAYAPAHNNLGNALIQMGQVDQAIEHYRIALRLNPDYAEAHNGLGNALLQAGALPEAQAQCETALQLNPDYVEAHCTLGLILAKQGRIPEAIEQFESALKLQPVNPKIKEGLDWLRGLQAQGAVSK